VGKGGLGSEFGAVELMLLVPGCELAPLPNEFKEFKMFSFFWV
jgi:hypothetical protein